MSIGDDGPEPETSTAPLLSTANSPRATSPSAPRRAATSVSQTARRMESSPRQSNGDSPVDSSSLWEVYVEELPLDPSRRCPDAFAVAMGIYRYRYRL